MSLPIRANQEPGPAPLPLNGDLHRRQCQRSAPPHNSRWQQPAHAPGHRSPLGPSSSLRFSRSESSPSSCRTPRAPSPHTPCPPLLLPARRRPPAADHMAVLMARLDAIEQAQERLAVELAALCSLHAGKSRAPAPNELLPNAASSSSSGTTTTSLAVLEMHLSRASRTHLRPKARVSPFKSLLTSACTIVSADPSHDPEELTNTEY